MALAGGPMGSCRAPGSRAVFASVTVCSCTWLAPEMVASEAYSEDSRDSALPSWSRLETSVLGYGSAAELLASCRPAALRRQHLGSLSKDLESTASGDSDAMFAESDS